MKNEEVLVLRLKCTSCTSCIEVLYGGGLPSKPSYYWNKDTNYLILHSLILQESTMYAFGDSNGQKETSINLLHLSLPGVKAKQ